MFLQMKLDLPKRFNFGTAHDGFSAHKVGLALPFYIALSATMQNALIASAFIFVTAMPAILICAFLNNKINKKYRILICSVSSVLIVAGLCSYIQLEYNYKFSSIFEIYFPLAALNTIMLGACSENFENKRKAIINTLFQCLKFSALISILSLIRELLAFGTILNRPIDVQIPKLSAASQPFFGMVVLGFLIAALNGISIVIGQSKYKKRSNNI